MSTQGVLILRRDKAEKGMKISHDAYPASAGADIVDLIKTTDLNALFDLLKEYDESEISECPETGIYPNEPEPFSYLSCRLAVRKGKHLCISSETKEDIKNSLFCEYGYVIDLDLKHLILYKGLQTKPMEGNPYGAAPFQDVFMNRPYYPCRPVAEFSFDYIRGTGTEIIIDVMRQAIHEYFSDNCNYPADGTTYTDYAQYRWEEKLLLIKAEIRHLLERLCYIEHTLPDLNPVSEKRYRELKLRYAEVNDAIIKLEEQIELIK